MDIGQEITSGKTESDFDVAALFLYRHVFVRSGQWQVL